VRPGKSYTASMSLGCTILVLTIYTLAVARLTRLINADTILDKPRVWLAGRSQTAVLVAQEAETHGQTERERVSRAAARRWATAVYFVQCPWCVGMWVALAAAYLPVRLIGWPWWSVIPVALAASHLVGLSARFADTEDMSIEDDTPTG
jgi:hypothetical protein